MVFNKFTQSIYKFVRKSTKPMAQEKARIWKNRLTIIYTICAWNALGLLIYQTYIRKDIPKDPNSPEMTNAQQWSHILGVKKADVYHVSGFNVHKYSIDNTKDKQQTDDETLKS